MTVSRLSFRSIATVALVTCALVASGCGFQDGSAHRGDDAHSSAAQAAAAPTDLRLVTVGDIACPPGQAPSGNTCRQAATASLARGRKPDMVVTLGDHQYEKNSLAAYQGSYDRSWGSLLGKTYPVLGNHEYYTSGAAGYYSYFKDRQPGPPGYYRVKANGWNIYLLNSNCTKVSCATEASWLDRQMAANPSKCSVIAMHHPRYSSGQHGNNTAVTPLWSVAYKHRNDIVLSGHDHDYERFKPKDHLNNVRPLRGMLSFVSGTGGKNLYRLRTRRTGSAYFQARTHGVLSMILKPGSFSWSYRNISGTVMDRGSRSCI